MDKAPIIIGYGLINSDGNVVCDKEVKSILKQIKSKFGASPIPLTDKSVSILGGIL